ncbi:MAG: hypothetical protein SGI94_20560, partial [Saprospiraceae bacterium]|nr:hypothetical protein [Saprospiraceae bacterium]
LLLSVGLFSIKAQTSCLPQGITLNAQQQVNDFQNNYPGCTHILGSLVRGWALSKTTAWPT